MSNAVDRGLVPLRARPTVADRTSRVGMIVFIGGWTMMFGALLVAFLLLRSGISAEYWPPPGVPRLDLSLPTIATGALLASSGVLHLAIVAVRGARPRALVAYLVAGITLAVSFLVLQLLAWRYMLLRGMQPTASLYAASFFGLTIFHALHALVGVIGLSSLVPRARRGAFGAHDHLAVRNWTLYWHFVGIMWLVFFAAIAWS
jgi:heme/copper-type cytochrome/quinol oxidase subunit 3